MQNGLRILRDDIKKLGKKKRFSSFLMVKLLANSFCFLSHKRNVSSLSNDIRVEFVTFKYKCYAPMFHHFESLAFLMKLEPM